MIQFFKSNIEPNKKIRWAEIALVVLMLIGSISSVCLGLSKVHGDMGTVQYKQTIEMTRSSEDECDEDSTVCDVTYAQGKKEMVVPYTYEDYTKLDQKQITAYVYETANGTQLYFNHKDVSNKEMHHAYKQTMANQTMSIFNLGTSLLILVLSVSLILLFSKQFTTYEKSWFLSIMVFATIFSVLFPEESANGVNGIWIMLLYLLDTFFNILCELLISKQSRYNFLVSIVVEILEILICVVLMYRFATMVVTLCFWLPIDIISYINWTKHRDDEEEELTMVRRLKGYQEVLVILAIIVWTVVVGYFISGLNIATDFYHNKSLETVITYIDACASAVGIANGLFIFFRLREQWIAWYICAILEGIINILSGQYVLLILKLGYITNSTYGYIKWSKYIKSHQEDKKMTIF